MRQETHRRFAVITGGLGTSNLRGRFAQERNQLLREVEAVSGKTFQRPFEALPDIFDHLGFRVAEKPLAGDRQWGELDPWNRTVFVCSQLEEKLEHRGAVDGVRAFTLAHELGHIILHLRDLVCGPLRPYHEAEADHFAGVFLVPQRLLKHHPAFAAIQKPERHREDVWDLALSLARYFSLTGSAMAVQLEHLGVVTRDGRSLLGISPVAPAPDQFTLAQ